MQVLIVCVVTVVHWIGFVWKLIGPFIGVVSAWLYFFGFCFICPHVHWGWPSFGVFYGEISFYSLESYVCSYDFDKNPHGVVYTTYTHSAYRKWFFNHFLFASLINWRSLRQTAFLFNFWLTTSFTFLCIWHYFLLQHLPGANYLNILFLGLMLWRKLLCLGGHFGTLQMFCPVSYHAYEYQMQFGKPPHSWLSFLMVHAFRLVLIFFFVGLAFFGFILSGYRLSNEALLFFQ